MTEHHDDDQRLLQRCKALSQQVLVQNKRFAGEWDAKREEMDSISEQLKSLRSRAKAAGGDVADRMLANARECEQTLRNGPGGDLHKFRKRRSKPLILRLMMGPHCPVDVVRSEEAYKLKDEYHTFRARTAQLLILYSGALLVLLQRSYLLAASSPGALEPLRRKSFTPIVMVGLQVLLVWLVYIYLAMASRESLLLMNGSHIRPWWIWHHYLSALTCFIWLSLPVDSPTLQRFVRGWLAWTVLQATLMIFQNMYQRKRMYTRIALGKSSAMDVVGGESSGMRGQLLALLPGLFLLQAWQIVLGGSMVLSTAGAVLDARGWLELEAHEDELWARRGLCIIGLLMAGMGVTNAVQTMSTMVAKRRHGGARAARRTPTKDTQPPLDAPAQDAGVTTQSGKKAS